MSNLQLRIISGLVMAGAVLLLTWVGGLPFQLLSAVIAAAMFYEWCAMSGAENRTSQLFSAVLLAAVLIALVSGFGAANVLAIFAVAVVLSAVASIVLGQGAWTASGFAYAGLSGISVAFLRDGDNSGLTAILFLFATVWATDIFAYFVGRAIGGPKLAPSISPGKTWSGAIGGTVCGMIAGLAVAFAAGGNFLMLVPVVFLLSVVSQAGDLFESWAKRRNGVKDSSNIIPGHGGVMDRVDGLVAAAFALYVIGTVLSGPDHPAHGLFPA
jgi:phosphatidate cytidylyltransferase